MSFLEPFESNLIGETELRDRLMAAVTRELDAAFAEHKQLQLRLGYQQVGLWTSTFTRIWFLAAAFGLLSVIPLLLFSDRYPWAVFAVIVFGSICTLAIDLLSSHKKQIPTYYYTPGLAMQPQPIDLSHRKTIDVDMFYQRDFWTKHFGVSEEELKEAVLTVGNDIETLRAYFEFRRSKAADTSSPESTGE
jgi:hypothetical protein